MTAEAEDGGAGGSTPPMKTILETIQGGTDYLVRHGIDQARLNMELLVAHVLACDRMRLYVDFDRPLGEAELAPLRELVKRRRGGEPLQHLLGEVEFFGRRFGCDGRALVPRPETEELVERILGLLRAAPGGGGGSGRTVLDLGCGSGVIGLTLAAELGAGGLARVVLADVSGEALALARENAGRISSADARGSEEAAADRSEREAAGRVQESGRGMPPLEFVATDLFAGLAGRRFDLVAANLPYVASGEIDGLSPEVRRDPRAALDGGPEGTEVMRTFLTRVANHLEPRGWVAMEIGVGQGAGLAAVAEAAGLCEVSCLPDLSGNERFLFARGAGVAGE